MNAPPMVHMFINVLIDCGIALKKDPQAQGSEDMHFLASERVHCESNAIPILHITTSSAKLED